MRGLLLTCLLATVGLLPAAAQVPAPDSNDKMEAYLERLGLTDLHIVYLEQEIARQSDSKRAVYARKLADLYAQQLLTVSDPRQAQDLQRRIQELLKTYPAANTLVLQVLLLQGEYLRAEALAARWILDPEQIIARDEARKLLLRIAPDLNKHQDRLQGEVRRLALEVERLPEGPARTFREQELNRLSALANRASYFDAWTGFYLGLMAPTKFESDSWFKKARIGFERLLGLDREQFEKPDAETLGLDSEARARMVLGLGLVELAGGNAKAGLAWLKVLRDPLVASGARDQLGYWQVWALLRANLPDKAGDVARQEIAGFSDAGTPGKVGLCAVLVRHGFAGGHSGKPELRQELGMLGLQGLLRIRRFDLARKFLFKYQIGPAEREGFLMLLLDAQNQLEEASKGAGEKAYQTASAAFRKALAAADAAREPQLAAEARYWLGVCHHGAGELDRALAEFKQSGAALKVLKSSLAADAAWMQAVVIMNRIDQDAKQRPAALEAFRSFRQDFPQHPLARKADYHIGRLSLDIHALENVPPGADSYLQARRDLCRYYYDEWLRLRHDAGKGPVAVTVLRAAIEKYLPLVAANPASKLECMLMLADLALQGTPQDLPQARQHLATAEPLAGMLMPADRLAGEYRYRRLLLAQALQDRPVLREHADWLCEHWSGSDLEEAARIALAHAADEAVDKAADTDKAALRIEALTAYRKLVALLGSSPEKLSTSPNAQSASRRYARYALDTGNMNEALLQLDKLLVAHPRDAALLRQAGLAHFQLEQYDRALEHWRTLAGGLPVDSPDWFEAKFHELACLARTDPKLARKEFDQLKQATPALGGDRWRSEFKKVERILGQ